MLPRTQIIGFQQTLTPFCIKMKQYLITAPLFQYRGFSDEKSVRNRMRSIQSIQKITKAMKMVASSKLRYDQLRREAGSPFCSPVLNLFNKLPYLPGSQQFDLQHKHIHNKKDNVMLLIAVSTDKGLCGGVNSTLSRRTRREIRHAELQGYKVQLIGIGDKIRTALQRTYRNRFLTIFTEYNKYPLNFEVAAIIANRILTENSEKSTLLFNAFRSIISFDTTRQPLLTTRQAYHTPLKEFDKYEFEPERALILQDLLEFYTASAVFNSLLENTASEQSARMAAMEGASTNATDMLSTLTLKYNKARQMKVTMELIEIVSGANAL